MQERKDFTPKLFYELSLDRLVPADNLYRKINQELDLHFLYQYTRGIKNANKHVLMAALTYNLKKYLKFFTRKVHRNAQIMNLPKGKFWFWQNLIPNASITSI